VTESEIQEKEKLYEEMKQAWMDVMANAPQSPLKLEEPSLGAVGDENENADVVSKLLERRHRIGT
jgi:hypothetical protein